MTQPVVWVNVCTFVAPDVTLADGRVVKSDSREWFAEVEARSVLDMPERADRHRYMDGVRKRRGDAAADRLRDDVLRLWRLARQDAK